ncbi:MAG: hypothetical protein KKF52_04575 [Nanoarchaeota archaeon]|nr:hypothetical protein [Nanoarchaeota archaeon]MBU4242478.1 hypothetical protein [Nanoarchaeota archaeon]MBU4351986.1 hypothetical protein [Nanoarchaeota archaeon]
MENKELTDIVLNHIKGIKFVSKGKTFMISSEGINNSFQKLKKEINKQKTTLKDNFGGKHRMKALEQTIDKINPEKENYSFLLQTTQEYLNLFQNFYNGYISKEKFIPIMKNFLIDNYTIDFNEAYSSQIKSEKSLKKIRNGSLLATMGSAYILLTWPSLPLVALTLGLGIGTGIFQGAIYSFKKTFKEGKKLIEEDNSLRNKIEKTDLEEFENVLIYNKKEIMRIIELY